MFLIFSKIVFSAQKGVVRPCALLPFRVGRHVCLGPTKDANVASLVGFDQGIDVKHLLIIFFCCMK